MFKKILCLLYFNHILSVTSIEEGEGTDFRYITSCKCGKKNHKDNWTDDNHALGHGTE